MRVSQVLLARVVLLADIRTPVYFPDLIAGITARYGFVKSPTSPQEILSPEGVLTFQHGHIVPPDSDKREQIIINTLTIQRQAIMVEVSRDTNDADYVLTDLVDWCTRTFDPRLESELTPVQPRLYISHLEIAFSSSLNRVLMPLSKAIHRLNETLMKQAKANFASPPPPVEAQSLIMNVDPTRWVLPCDFRVERRVSSPYEQNVYFSQAPLQTLDHTWVLQELDEGLAG